MTALNRWQTGKYGKDISSMKVGGPIRYFSRPRTTPELSEDIAEAQNAQLPFRVIGGGSNLIFSDSGFEGLIIQPAFTELKVLGEEDMKKYEELIQEFQMTSPAPPRYRSGKEEGVLNLQAGSVQEEGESVVVELGAGVPWGQAVMWSFTQQLTGLQWYARIPCQVGGAVFNNIHGEKHLLSESVVGVRALDIATKKEQLFGTKDLQFGYDQSRFHQRSEVITSALFLLKRVSPAEAQKAKELYLSWTAEKAKVQPSGANCGSVFQNISEEQAAAIKQTPLAAAWYVDQCGMRGVRVGGMQVYEKHANFIINDGTGTQEDFIVLVQKIRQAVHEKFNLQLEPEAECIDSEGNRLAW